MKCLIESGFDTTAYIMMQLLALSFTPLFLGIKLKIVSLISNSGQTQSNVTFCKPRCSRSGSIVVFCKYFRN
jgi:hypothetical protein